MPYGFQVMMGHFEHPPEAPTIQAEQQREQGVNAAAPGGAVPLPFSTPTPTVHSSPAVSAGAVLSLPCGSNNPFTIPGVSLLPSGIPTGFAVPAGGTVTMASSQGGFPTSFSLPTGGTVIIIPSGCSSPFNIPSGGMFNPSQFVPDSSLSPGTSTSQPATVASVLSSPIPLKVLAVGAVLIGPDLCATRAEVDNLILEWLQRPRNQPFSAAEKLSVRNALAWAMKKNIVFKPTENSYKMICGTLIPTLNHAINDQEMGSFGGSGSSTNNQV